MEQKQYIAPLVEDVELEMEEDIVATSFGDEPEYGGQGDPEVNIPD